jgi:alkanesulfonate monooxygenase SsuD/methylene tetrahydromethanopterin reductase-like flavin-dependent oxidoreductase (luciferase family)
MFCLPTIPGTFEERERLRPISSRTERFQQMLDEFIELARMAEDLGFEIVATTEHHLHSEGLEMGHAPSLNAYLAMNTSHVKVGPIGYVLPSWDPLRLAIEIGWLDQITKGRTIVGMARGYQPRWLDQMTQHAHSAQRHGATARDDSINRRLFDEVFDFLKLAWSDEPFVFDGEFWQYPFPAGSGTPWPASSWTETYGFPGEVADGRIAKISVVPKPYQRPHPPLFTAFSASESTVAWAAREQVNAVLLGTSVERSKKLSQHYVDEAAKVGRRVRLGEHIAVSHFTVFGSDRDDAYRRAAAGRSGTYYQRFGGVFGFWEAFRRPGDEVRWPAATSRLPESEWTIDRLGQSGHLIAGDVADVRQTIDRIAEEVDPEYFVYNPNQGLGSIEDCRKDLLTFGEEIMPHYR